MGVAVAAVYTEYDAFLVHKFFSIPTFLIVIGSLVIVISFFGCWGALKENYCLVLSFSVLLGLIFILELAAGISGYVLRSDAENLIKGSLTESMKDYSTNNTNDVTILWDYVQRAVSLTNTKLQEKLFVISTKLLYFLFDYKIVRMCDHIFVSTTNLIIETPKLVVINTNFSLRITKLFLSVYI